MYYNITYKFLGKGSESKCSFFRLDRLLKWFSLMKSSLEYVTIETYVKDELFNKFTLKSYNGEFVVIGGEL